MKPDIHPKYVDATLSCACGASYETRSTKGSYQVEICAACHPVYTGLERRVDKKGRAERFRKKFGSLDDIMARS